MKKIVNGKMYDTETAKVIGTYKRGRDERDSSRIEETLYQKTNGEFYLWGSGGANTKYRVILQLGQTSEPNKYLVPNSILQLPPGSASTGSEKVIPLTVDQAKKWVEQYCTAEVYCETFGTPEE